MQEHLPSWCLTSGKYPGTLYLTLAYGKEARIVRSLFASRKRALWI